MKKERQRQEEQQKQAQKPKSQDGDLDGPKEEELVPEKLAKVFSFKLLPMNLNCCTECVWHNQRFAEAKELCEYFNLCLFVCDRVTTARYMFWGQCNQICLQKYITN